MRKAIFLDRDGVINIDKEYVHMVGDFELIPRTIEALSLLQDSGYLLFVITSQSGIGRGYYAKKDFHRLNDHMLGLFSGSGIRISKVYYCPHSPEEMCRCRKPSTAFIRDAEKEFGIDIAGSFVIGDKTSDIEMGKAAGCTAILVKTGEAGRDMRYKTKPDFTAKDLYAAAELIARNKKHAMMKK